MSLNIGDKVKVNDNIQIQIEDEEKFIGEEAEVVNIISYVYPIEIKFKNPEIQKLNESMGKRMFDDFELTKM